jgi:integrase
MSETLHRKLSVLAAKTGRKKVDQSADAVGGWIEGGGRVSVHPSLLQVGAYLMVTYQNVNRPGLHPKGIRAAFCWSRNETRILTEAEVAALMACETDLRNYLILRLLYIAGLRVTELCTLKWSDTVPRGETGLRCKAREERFALFYYPRRFGDNCNS